ncbi:MAG: thioredoxin family protein [Candidatus Taylorbacteria bacterium]|nr:thioredoxin family protein [Candidatus Taylorbacteria bacterium]
MEKCQAWRKEHKSCNLEIIKHSIKNMTNNNNSQNGSTPLTTKGFAMPSLIAIIALVIVVGGIGYFATRTKPSSTAATQTPAGEKTLPDDTVVKADSTTVKPDGTMVKPDGTMIKPDGTMVKPDGTMEKKEGETAMNPSTGSGQEKMMAKYTGAVLAGKSAPLLDFTKADYDEAVKSDKLVVLYFYANWCPICKVEFPLAQAAFNELTTDKVVGFRVNYKDSDTDADEVALARQFGVAYQHTKVFLKNGKQILKAPDSWDNKRYNIEINKAINQ